MYVRIYPFTHLYEYSVLVDVFKSVCFVYTFWWLNVNVSIKHAPINSIRFHSENVYM